MQVATVVGRATSTVKHPTLSGWRLLITQPLGVNDSHDGAPQLVIDPIGAGLGDRVIICADGAAARDIVGSDKTPVRWVVMGLVDER